MSYNYDDIGKNIKEGKHKKNIKRLKSLFIKFVGFIVVLLFAFMFSLFFDAAPWSASHFKIYNDSLLMTTYNMEHDAAHQQNYAKCFNDLAAKYQVQAQAEQKSPTFYWIQNTCSKQENIETIPQIKTELENQSNFMTYVDFVKALILYNPI